MLSLPSYFMLKYVYACMLTCWFSEALSRQRGSNKDDMRWLKTSKEVGIACEKEHWYPFVQGVRGSNIGGARRLREKRDIKSVTRIEIKVKLQTVYVLLMKLVVDFSELSF